MMKYVLLVSHGNFAQGIHSVLDMMAGKGRNDILSTSLKDGMSIETFGEKVKDLVKDIKEDDKVILLGDIIGGSPLTATLNVLNEKGILKNTIAFGGANVSCALNALLMKDALETNELKETLISESRESIQELELNTCDGCDDDI